MPDALPLDHECFFIAPIGKEGSPERNRSDGVLEFIVSKAADELGLIALRGDQIGEPGQITLQVLDHILGARAAVADLTGLNANVFYELAVRHTARLPVVLIAEKGSILPFDIAQMRTIHFDSQDLRSADHCRQEIVRHLREALDNGAVDSPIATTVDVRALQAGSAAERNIAELVTSLEELARLEQQQADATMERLTRLETVQNHRLKMIHDVLKENKDRDVLDERVFAAMLEAIRRVKSSKALLDERGEPELFRELSGSSNLSGV
jgi:hypothetical protein